MSPQTIEEFHVIGIAVRTTNENGQSATDIPKLWERFMNENIIDQIPNKVNQAIYCMYTDYEKDHMKPYTTVLGCSVKNPAEIPAGMVGKTIKTASYANFNVKGNLADGLVYNEWVKIWGLDLSRAFTTDFEIYGEKAQDQENAEVEILIALNS